MTATAQPSKLVAVAQAAQEAANKAAADAQRAALRSEGWREAAGEAAAREGALARELPLLEEEMESAKQLPDMGFEAYNPG